MYKTLFPVLQIKQDILSVNSWIFPFEHNSRTVVFNDRKQLSLKTKLNYKMNKNLSQSLAIRGIVSILLGFVFIAWPGLVVSYLVLVLGALLVLSSALPMIYSGLKGYGIPWGNTPSLILGILLLAFPAFFVSVIMYVLGIILILAGLNQVLTYSSIKKNGISVPGYYYIFPVIMLLSGVIILFNPFNTAAALFIYFGVIILFYGITEVVAALKAK